MSQKRIGIITLYYNNNNYGGLAQAYALCNYLSGLGYSAKQLSFHKAAGLSGSLKDRIIIHMDGKGGKGIMQGGNWLVKRLFDEIVLKKYNRYHLNKYAGKLNIRKQAFVSFRERIPHSKIYDSTTIAECVKDYDCFICGSDQVWKPGVIQDAFVLKFVPEGKKKISYAASIAIQGIEKRKWFCSYLKSNLDTFHSISVREKGTQKELETVIEKEVDLVVDPTLLLSKEEWNKNADKRIIEERYIFTYFLGSSKTQREFVQRIAQQNKYKIAALPFAGGKYIKSDEGFGDYRFFDIGIPGFLSLVKYADIVITDSFHAICFSYIFEREFYVLERKEKSKSDKMNSRIESILQMMGINERFICEMTDISVIPGIDYSVVNENMAGYISYSKAFLDKALESSKDEIE